MEEKIDFLLVLKAGRRRFFMSSYKRKDKHKKKIKFKYAWIASGHEIL